MVCHVSFRNLFLYIRIPTHRLVDLLYARFSPLQQPPNFVQMPLCLTSMLALPFKRLDGDGNARFHNMSLPSYASNDADTHLLSGTTPCVVLEGQVPYHTSLRSSLNASAGTLCKAHVTAFLGLRLSGLTGYRDKIVDAIGRIRNTVRRLLGHGATPSPRAQKRPTTTPTTWFCHICQSGPYNISAQNGCTNVINGRQCDHHMCDYCKKED